MQVIRQTDDRYLKPGALDAHLTGVFDTYKFKFLNKYQVSHDWPRNSKGCRYRSLPTLGVTDGSRGEFYVAPEIYEKDGATWQASNTGRPPYNFDRFVRSTYKEEIPEFDKDGKKTGNMQEVERTGLTPVCFEAWVGTSHTLVFRLHKRDISAWRVLWSAYNPKGHWSQKQVGNNKWWALENEESDLDASAKLGGWFKSWLLPIADTDYTISIQLGATQQSLKKLQTHASFQAMFQHLIESVKIEQYNP
jgi:hypothetical protein